MLIVHHLGKNVTIKETMDGKLYEYQYMRSKSEYSTISTFSDNLEDLKKLYEKELMEQLKIN